MDFKYITISFHVPAVVNYVEKYIPELLPKMMPIHSPMMCMAIYIKKYLKCDDELAFISPCIAKEDRDYRSKLLWLCKI